MHTNHGVRLATALMAGMLLCPLTAWAANLYVSPQQPPSTVAAEYYPLRLSGVERVETGAKGQTIYLCSGRAELVALEELEQLEGHRLEEGELVPLEETSYHSMVYQVYVPSSQSTQSFTGTSWSRLQQEGFFQVTIAPGSILTLDRPGSYRLTCDQGQLWVTVQEESTLLPQPDPEQIFWDVPRSHWSFSWVNQAYSMGMVGGYDDSSFAPDATVSSGELCTMLTGLLYPEDRAEPTSQHWWSAYVETMQVHGLLEGTQLRAEFVSTGQYGTRPDQPITRYDVAQMIRNYLQTTETVSPTQEELEQIQAQISDWDTIPSHYQEAVALCYAQGLLTGTDQGFSGASSITRAEACVVLCNLHQLEDQDMEPVSPEKIPTR